MELELRQETVRGWESVCRTGLEQEETAEMIVPDACPDIWQVLDADSRLLLQRKEPQEGKAELAGLLKTTILYQPEGDGGVCALEVTLPFSAGPELNQLTRRCVLRVQPRVLSVDVHLLNPRKVLVRVGYQLEVEGFAPQALALASLVEEPDAYAIRQKTDVFESFATVNAQEKNFTYQDAVTLPAGRPDVKELLRTQAQCTCTEARVIGSKLVFKGEAVLKLLCRGEDNSLFSVDFHLPYSQIMDAGEDSEEAQCSMDLLFTDVKCTPDPDDRRTFQVELALQAQAVLRKQVSVPVLTDLYSAVYDLQPQEQPCPSLRLMGRGEEQETARAQLETSGTPGTILDVQVRLGRTGHSQEGQDLILTQEAEVTALYESEEGPAAARQKVTVSHRIPGQAGEMCLVTSALFRDPTASPVGEGIEVTFALSFQWMVLDQETRTIISGVTVGEKREENTPRPSVVLRAVRVGETLWDIAKSYLSTDGEIMEASGLTSGELYPGQMLLIPRKIK